MCVCVCMLHMGDSSYIYNCVYHNRVADSIANAVYTCNAFSIFPLNFYIILFSITPIAFHFTLKICYILFLWNCTINILLWVARIYWLFYIKSTLPFPFSAHVSIIYSQMAWTIHDFNIKTITISFLMLYIYDAIFQLSSVYILAWIIRGDRLH